MTDGGASPPQAEPMLVLDRVSHRYDAGAALDEVSLEVYPGELMCLLGPSGCGKTTALRIAAGLEAPLDGRVLLDGRVVSGGAVHRPPEERRIGFMPQDFALFPHLRVLDNVAFGLDGVPHADRDRRSRRMLEEVGMAAYADAWPHQLSGGQQQRIALARALAPRPRLMLLDEPFSGLDRALRDQIWEETVSILRDSAVATLMVSHDPEEAMAMADRIAVMREGRTIQTGRPGELYDLPRDAFVAALFGPVNRFEAVVEAGAVATPVGRFPAPALPDGTAAVVLIRPEALRPLPDEAGDLRVEAVRVRGAFVSLRLLPEPGHAGGPGLLARVSRGLRAAPGQRMRLAIDPAGVFVFTATDGRG